MTFEERLKYYKKYTDYFVADIHRADGCETKHDLTWGDVMRIKSRASKNSKIRQVDILVEDWDGEDDWLFKDVESIEKEASKWMWHLDTGEMEEIEWRMKGE